MKVARYLRLKSEHPLRKKVEQVFKLMDDLNIAFEVADNHFIIKDYTEKSSTLFYLKDIESDDNYVEALPPVTDYKITKDNPQYFEEQEKQRLQQVAELELKTKALEAARSAKLLLAKQEALNVKKTAAIKLQEEISSLEKELI
jgi:hypothetical protein